jgi:hypothetical protein
LALSLSVDDVLESHNHALSMLLGNRTMMDTVEQYCKQFGIVENPESVGVLRRFLDKSIQVCSVVIPI